jgi:hypothetical protein
MRFKMIHIASAPRNNNFVQDLFLYRGGTSGTEPRKYRTNARMGPYNLAKGISFSQYVANLDWNFVLLIGANKLFRYRSLVSSYTFETTTKFNQDALKILKLRQRSGFVF